MSHLPTEGLVLRMYLGEADRQGHEPMYEVLVVRARRLGLAGATVFRGSMGFGARQEMRTEKILRLSNDLPVVVEIVDEAEKIRAALPELEQAAPSCLFTLQAVELRRPAAGA